MELEEVSRAQVSVGPPTPLVLSQQSASLWAGGNEVAVLSSEDGGRMELRDSEGRVRTVLPSEPT